MDGLPDDVASNICSKQYPNLLYGNSQGKIFFTKNLTQKKNASFKNTWYYNMVDPYHYSHTDNGNP